MKPIPLVAAALVFGTAFMVSAPAAQAPATFSIVPEANELFLKGREFLARSDPRTGGTFANARQAIATFEQAIAKDPQFALAYVDMARAWLRLGYSNPDGAKDEEIMPPARAALAKALQLDPKLADAHLATAAIAYNLDYDWDKAGAEYALGLQLAPGNADAHTSYASYLSTMGRFPEALKEQAQAQALAPSAQADFAFARIHYAMRDYDAAADYCNKSLARQDNLVVRFYLGLIHVAQKQYDKAIAELEATTHERNGGALAGLAYAYAMAGNPDRARELAGKLFVDNTSGLIVPYRMAAVYLALGDKDKAFEWLGKSYAERDNWLAQLKVDPVMDPLRSDPRFKELMHKLRFDPV
jgi:tetratricopeptide (TPR) repeat protein